MPALQEPHIEDCQCPPGGEAKHCGAGQGQPDEHGESCYRNPPKDQRGGLQRNHVSKDGGESENENQKVILEESGNRV